MVMIRLPIILMPKLFRKMKPSKEIIDFIKAYEQLHDGDSSLIGIQPKPDARGIWTEGYGRAMKRNGRWLTTKEYPTVESIIPFATMSTEEEAEKALAEDLERFSKGVLKRLKIRVSQNEFDALLSHSYNCGFSETLYRLVNSNSSEEKIKSWITGRYITAGGKYLKGLQYRRNDEYEIWAGINYKREYKISI